MIISDYTVLFQEFNFYNFFNDYLKFYYNEDTIESLPVQNNLIIRKFISHDLQEIQDEDFIYELDLSQYQIITNQKVDNQYTILQQNRSYSDEWYHELSEYNRGDIPKTDKYIHKQDIETDGGVITLHLFKTPNNVMFRNLKTTGEDDDHIDIRKQFTPLIYKESGVEKLYNPLLTDNDMYARINQVTIVNLRIPPKLIDIQYKINRYLNRKINDDQIYYITVFTKFSSTGYPEKVVIQTIRIESSNNIDTNMINLIDSELYSIYSQLSLNSQIPIQALESNIQEFDLQLGTTLDIPQLEGIYTIENSNKIYIKDIITESNIQHGNQIYNNLVLQSQLLIKQNPSSNQNITIFDRDLSIFDINYTNQIVDDIGILTGV